MGMRDRGDQLKEIREFSNKVIVSNWRVEW
jgi:hypothetical protein